MPTARSEDRSHPEGRSHPLVELDDPSPAQARRAVADRVEGVGLEPRDADGLVLAVSEVVANAHRHGAPPVRVVIQSQPGQVVVEVSDGGRGPDERYLGVAPDAPPPDATVGRGRWLAYRSCAEVVEFAGGSGFTVRLTGGATSP